jgi:hypothetical protein
MKKSIIIFIVGMLFGTSSIVYGDSRIKAIKAYLNKETKISVDGELINLNNPILTFEGRRTYRYENLLMY